MSRQPLGSVCPYCGVQTKMGEHLVWCSQCGTIHHENCWVKKARCSTRDCSGTPERDKVEQSDGNAIQKMFGSARLPGPLSDRKPEGSPPPDPPGDTGTRRLFGSSRKQPRSEMKISSSESTKRTVQKMFGVSYTEEAFDKICPYCQDYIADGEQAMICGRCGMPHHIGCWNENGGCTTYGCVPVQVRRSNSSSSSRGNHLDLTTVYLGDDSEEGAVAMGLGLVIGLAAGAVGGFFISGWIIAVLGAVSGAAIGTYLGRAVYRAIGGGRSDKR